MRIPTLCVVMLLVCPLTLSADEPINVAVRQDVAAIGRVTAVARHSDGRIAIGLSSGGVQVMAADHLIARRFDGVTMIQSGMPRLNALAWSPDGQHLAVGGGLPAESGSVEIFESLSSEWRCTHRSTLHDDIVTGLAWSPDSKWLASAGHDGIACVMQLPSELTAEGGPATASSVIRVPGHSRGLACVAWTAEDQLVSGSLDHTLRVWDLAPTRLRGGSEAEPFDGKPNSSSAAPSVEPSAARQTRRGSGSEPIPELLRTLKNHTSAVSAIALRPPVELRLLADPAIDEASSELTVLASAGHDRTVRFWQPQIGRMMRFVRLPASPLAVAWHPDRQHVFVGTSDGRLHVVTFNTAEVQRSISVLSGPVWGVAVIDQGRHVLVGGPAGVTVVALVD